MPWEKSFDTENTLAKAMEAFWVRGYEATSMQDLVDCMGIGRGSLYATFSDKRSLFIRALRRYDLLYRNDWTNRLKNMPSGKAAIMAAFESVIDAALGEGGRNGCFLINTGLELSPRDEEIAGIVSECLVQMERFFREQLDRAKAAGEIPDHVLPDQTAKTLLALLVSLRVFARARPEPALLRAVAAQAEALIS